MDMIDFSRRNRMPTPTVPVGVESITDGIDGLAIVVSYVYKPSVIDLLSTTRRFSHQLRINTDISDPEAFVELTCWIDERFEKLRSLLAQADTETA